MIILLMILFQCPRERFYNQKCVFIKGKEKEEEENNCII
jgi:hypothetical protein